MVMEDKDIKVSIRCITYNHIRYIQQCLDGIVMQKTNFRFVAIVHDDASTDGTADVVRDYAKKYPDIVLPILQKENQYSKGYERIRNILDEHTKGKYVAICEGDDYWTDPLKLQKQYDWMESHPDYTACFHPAQILYEEGNHENEISGEIEDRDYAGPELFMWKHRPPTASIFFKHVIYESSVYKQSLEAKLSFGDTPLFLACAHEGKVRGMSEVMSVYRKHVNGITETFKAGSKAMLKFADDQHKLYKIFGDEYKEEAINIYVVDYVNFFFLNLHQGKCYLFVLLKVFFEYPRVTMTFLRERLKAWLKKNNKK